jgi:hypothetical protein
MATLSLAQQKEVKRLCGLGMTEAEAVETVLYDDEVEHGRPTEFDLTPEQEKVAKKYTAVGTKKRTNYTFTKRERKPNEAKRELIEILRQALAEMDNVKVSNIERQIDFDFEGEQFSVTLTQHRKPKA